MIKKKQRTREQIVVYARYGYALLLYYFLCVENYYNFFFSQPETTDAPHMQCNNAL